MPRLCALVDENLPKTKNRSVVAVIKSLLFRAVYQLDDWLHRTGLVTTRVGNWICNKYDDWAYRVKD
jgi:hypothetical protein